MKIQLFDADFSVPKVLGFPTRILKQTKLYLFILWDMNQ